MPKHLLLCTAPLVALFALCTSAPLPAHAQTTAPAPPASYAQPPPAADSKSKALPAAAAPASKTRAAASATVPSATAHAPAPAAKTGASVEAQASPTGAHLPIGIDTSEIKGPCTIMFVITADGHIAHLAVKKSSGSASFDQACLEAIRHAHALPGVQNGKPYAERCEQTFTAG